jgi:DNA polymerase III epsilon subunit-like protein
MTEFNSMQHWNGSMMCAMDVETTGLDDRYNEVCQLAILPLNSNLEPIQNILPLNLHIIPSGPEVIDPEALSVTKTKMHEIMSYGVQRERAVDLFVDWAERLPLPLTRGGYRGKIIPLCHNGEFDHGFVKGLLGQAMFDNYFHARSRDTQSFSCEINDMFAMCGIKVRYSKNNLAWLAKQHGVDITGAHDALVDCKITAAVYKAMVEEFSKNIPLVDYGG